MSTDPQVRAAETTGREPAPVLYIGGNGRSGSTLLERMLAQVPGLFSGGELRYLWRRGLKENRLCGCGTPFRDCEFWSAVGREAFGGWSSVDVDEVVRLELRVVRHRFLPLMLAPGLWPGYQGEIHRFAGFVGPLYRAIRRVSGADVVVDSTKDPSYAYILRRVQGLDVRVVHLVRDSRGVAYSWTKQVVTPDVTDREAHLPRFPPVQIGARWVTHNLYIEFLRTLGHPEIALRYESLVHEPRREMQKILRLAGRDPRPDDLAFISDGEVNLAPGHSVAGNPMRLRHGPIALRLDEQWRSRMSPRSRALVTAVTWPMLRRYGYDPSTRAAEQSGAA